MFLLAVVEEGDQDGAIAQVVYSLPVFFCEAFLAKEFVYRLFARLLVCVIRALGTETTYKISSSCALPTSGLRCSEC